MRVIYSNYNSSLLIIGICLLSAMEAFILLVLGSLEVAEKINVLKTASRFYGFIPIITSIIILLTCLFLIGGVIMHNYLFILPWLISEPFYICLVTVAWFMAFCLLDMRVMLIALPWIVLKVYSYIVVFLYYKSFNNRRIPDSVRIRVRYHHINRPSWQPNVFHSGAVINGSDFADYNTTPQELQELNSQFSASASANKRIGLRSVPQVELKDSNPPSYWSAVASTQTTLTSPSQVQQQFKRNMPSKSPASAASEVGCASNPVSQKDLVKCDPPSYWSAVANLPKTQDSMANIHSSGHQPQPTCSYPENTQILTSHGPSLLLKTDVPLHHVRQSKLVLKKRDQIWEEQV